MIPSRHRLAFLLALMVLSGAACSDNSTEPDPEDPGPTTGSVTVTVATTGSDPDADGYTVTVGSSSQSVATSGSVTFTDLGAGATSVSLGGIAANCDPAESNPQTVDIVVGETGNVTFTVRCVALLEEFSLMAADRDGNVYTVDPATGAESLSFTPMTDDGAGGMEPLGVISSMAWVPVTDAWWFGLGGNSVCGTEGCVFVEDTVSGSATQGQWRELVRTQLRAIAGLAVHPDGDRIFTFEADASGQLYEFDPITGDTTEVLSGLSEGSQGKGTTFSADTMLYVWGRDRLTEIDVDAGTWSTVVDSMVLTGFPTLVDTSPTIGSMTTRPSDGVVFGILKDGGGGGTTTTTYLVTVNPATGEVTNVGVNTGLLDGLAFIPTRLVN